MKLKDFNGETKDILVEIPDDVFKKNLYAGPKTNKVYIVSWWGAGLWVKDDLTSTRIYPITDIEPEDALEWNAFKKEEK